ncbi:protein of unknown function [Taphrina deformans PYCC 5710]|uniref:Uncharacterized protein n=1 Tax=Taphrina deformans (strain PYCC 5710 / ATCC 11124 / CBS 356.35 / IMI 108563 / JCM 9778 / NBRC 8474) TaxID=1097556 RepID=R4XGH8_TAPDE|nr:protein of unknown function [Taphrina deformans PYCC 5710]|eukprot:CCG84752.1 protein of unknown function [Taphrina deformans PYCC 5710]
MALQPYFDTIVAFGDSFSSQCGFDTVPTRMRWTDFSHGLHNNLILKDCGLTGGWNYLNFLSNCTTDSIDPLQCPIKLIDIAHGSAVTYKNPTLFNGIESPDLSGALQLPGQLAQWNQYVRPELPAKLDRTLGVIWFGINDMHLFQAKNLEKELESKHATMLENGVSDHIDSIGDTVKQLHTDGVRTFMIPNVPLDVDGAAGLINTWNRMLRLRMDNWTDSFDESTFYSFDAYAMFNHFQAYPDQYGFSNIEDACYTAAQNDSAVDCGDLSSGYLMMDWVHWTAQAHWIMSRLMKESILRSISQQRQNQRLLRSMAHLDMTTRRFTAFLAALIMISISFVLGWLIHRRRVAANVRQKYAAIKYEERTVCDG